MCRVKAGAARHRAMRACGLDPARPLGAGPIRWPHGVPVRVFVGPAVAIPEHGIKGGEHFAHDRDDRDLRLFADPNEATVEGTQSRVEPDRGQGRHVECVADADTTAIDVALPAEPAAIEVVRRQADQRGDLLAADLAEFRAAGRAKYRRLWRRHRASSTAGGSLGQGLAGLRPTRPNVCRAERSPPLSW